MIDMNLIMLPPGEIKKTIGRNAKVRRKQMGLTQRDLALQSGMSLSSYRRFEQTGNISMDSFIPVCIVLDSIDELNSVFLRKHYSNIQEVIEDEKRRKR